MTLKFRSIFVFVLLTTFAASASPALAQNSKREAGKVTEIGGPAGSVLVVRGSQSYALQAGDILFLGDRIVTRTNGTVKVTVGGCARELGSTASIVVDEFVCARAVTTLAGMEIGVGIGTGDATGASFAGGAGATPGALSLLAVSGATAAASLYNSGGPIE